ncbi:MAG TPA: hypothetical protein VFI38_11225 [Candidatus Acidoferrum sp.]|nr:hypothetical protein [Candidatus Acidoferrum sp.]
MNLPLLRFSLLLTVFLFLAGAVPLSRGQEVESGYGPLPVFEFHSGFWVNLHQFLYREARLRESTPEAKAAAAGNPSGQTLKQTPISLSAEEQKTWEQAIAFYRANYAGKDPQINIDLILLKNQLGDFEDCDELLGRKKRACDAGLPGNVGVILEAAAPVYRAHWWANQDRANRRWVARVAPLIREQGVGLSQRLADIYQSTWPKVKIRVEVCAFANAAGAFTTVDPLRVTISSTEPRNQAPDSLEVLFHEASHGIAIPVQNAITRECRQRDKPIPRDLWHALVYYTTSEVLRPVMQEAAPDSLLGETAVPREANVSPMPPDLREKFTQRGWEEYVRLLKIYWQPYLDGRVNFEDAIAHLVSAV